MLYKANYLLCVEDITTYSAYNKLSSIWLVFKLIMASPS